MKTISKFSPVIGIIGVLYLLISGSLFSLNLLLVVQVLAFAIMPWARRSFQPGQFNVFAEPKEGQLLSSGPYRFIRHPMYASALFIVWVGVLGHFSVPNFIVGSIITAVIFIRILDEEQFLRQRYPNYLEYAHKTKRLIPFIV